MFASELQLGLKAFNSGTGSTKRAGRYSTVVGLPVQLLSRLGCKTLEEKHNDLLIPFQGPGALLLCKQKNYMLM